MVATKAVVIKLRDGTRISTKFAKGSQAKAFLELVNQEPQDDIVLTGIVDVRHAKPMPKNYKIPKGMHWCPYCRTARRFKIDDYVGVLRCELCGISTNDYWVKLLDPKFLGMFVSSETKKRRRHHA